MIHNPYIAGPPIRGALGFFGREEVFEWTIRELQNPSTNALVLLGQRRIGKTSLLLQLERRLSSDSFFPIYFDLQDQATRSLGDLLADLADTIVNKDGIEPPDPEAFDDRGRFFQRTFLPELYKRIGDQAHVVFLFDEFDVLGKAAEEDLPDTASAKLFFPFLRRLMSEEKRLSFVFVVGRRADDLSLDFNAIFKTALTREIWVLNGEAASKLIRQGETDDILHFSDEALSRILNLTNGHPYLIQLLCQRLWAQSYQHLGQGESFVIEVAHIEAVVPDALATGGQALIWLWDGLSPGEKMYASALAEIAVEYETISKDRVTTVLTENAPRLRAKEVNLAPQDLVKRRVLERVGENEYRFAIELFRRWVQQNRPLYEVKDELDRAVDELADNYFSIGLAWFKSESWDKAVEAFQNALDSNQHHFRARLYLGESLLKQDQVDEAVVELEKAYELDKDEARYPLLQALTRQAKILAEAGSEDAALFEYKRILSISPLEAAARDGKSLIWRQRGDRALETGDFETAAQAYHEAGDEEKAREAWLQSGEEAELARLFDLGIGYLEEESWAKSQRAFADIVYLRPDYEKDGQSATTLLADAAAKRRVRRILRRLPIWTWALFGVLFGLFLYWGGSQLMNAGQPTPPEIAGVTADDTSTATWDELHVPATATNSVVTATPEATEIDPLDNAVTVTLENILLKQTAIEKPNSSATPTPSATAMTTIPLTKTVGMRFLHRPIEGMVIAYVPAGSFFMGSDTSLDPLANEDSETPQHKVTLDGFWINSEEITNSQYARFLNEMGISDEYGNVWLNIGHDGVLIDEEQGVYFPKEGYHDFPIVGVSWFGADTYCRWLGDEQFAGQLPTEAEWEYAARGPESRIYPWGNEFDIERLKFAGDPPGLAPVGSYPQEASWVGAEDMAGNAWEWVSDWYGLYLDSAQTNPTGPVGGSARILKGGSWASGQPYMRSAYRYKSSPYDGQQEPAPITFGFRCIFHEIDPSSTLTPTPITTPIVTSTPIFPPTPTDTPGNPPPPDIKTSTPVPPPPLGPSDTPPPPDSGEDLPPSE